MAARVSFSLFLFFPLWQRTVAIPASSFVGVLTNLPTLAPVSYCTEVIGDGKPDVLHTKTGPVCTYNTIRSTTTTSPTAIFTASLLEQAAPSNQGNARTFPSTPDATGGAQPFLDQLDGKCTIFQKKIFDQYGKWDWRPIDAELSKQQCVSFCAEAFAENLANNQTAANACISWADPPAWENYNFVGETQVAQGSCECNGRLITSIAEWSANTAVPAIEEIACKTWITAISTVVTGGLAAIPEVGGAVATVAHAAMQAAVTLAYTMETAHDAGQGFTDWLNAPSTQVIDGACGNKYTSEEGQQVFEAFWTAASAVGPAKIFANAARNFPPPWAKGSDASKDLDDFLSGLVPGKDKGDKNGKPGTPSPLTPKPTRSVDQSSSLEPSSKPSQCSRRHGKRAPKDNDCSTPEVTSYLISGSQAVTARTAITSTCKAKDHPQACAHYHSAIKNGAPNRFVCEDANERDDAKATSDWSLQHDNSIWHSYTAADWVYTFKGEQRERPKCQKDEWPPAYFLPSSSDERKKQEWGQYVRWLPGSENGGAAQTWRNFCAKEDGGRYNGQRVRPRKVDRRSKVTEDDDSYNQVPFNTKLVDLTGKKQQPSSTLGRDNTLTHFSIWKDVPYTRAVFQLEFDWSGVGEPNAGNDWLLRDNACWPKDIVPQDPGYVLLTNDPWYKTAAIPDEYKKSVTENSLYASAPPQSMLDAAKQARPDVGKGRPAPERSGSEQAQDPEPPAKAPKPPQKRLELIGDRIVLRDVLFNTSRLLTEEELSRDIEIIQCADRHCRKERQELGEDDHNIIIPGTGPPTVPSANLAIPTPASGLEVASALMLRRTSLDGEIPFETGVIRIS